MHNTDEMNIQYCDLERAGEDGYGCYRIPAICCASDGSLLAAYECRLTPNDWDTRGIGLRRSTDGGVTWSGRVMVCVDDTLAVNNPLFIAGRDGTVWLLYQLNYERTFIIESRDCGANFGEPREITNGFDGLQRFYTFNVCAVGPGHGVELDSGRLVVPVWIANHPARHHAPSISGVIISDDRGVTWRASGAIFPRDSMENSSETTVAQLADGRVMLNIRHAGRVKRRAVSLSVDGDGGWSAPAFDDGLPDPTCCASLIRVGDRLVFSNCESESTRTELTIKFSYDDGRSWREPIRVWDAAGYSDICASPDGKTLYCFFERNSESALSVATVRLM